MQTYRKRAVESVLRRLLSKLPALLITGPRAAGKTTTAARFAATIVRLDRPAEAAAFRADPDAALRGLKEPVLLDEWQAAPEVLGAVKRAVDAVHRPGRYILTGSVRADIDAATWPGTGRLVRLKMHPMSVAEQAGRPAAMPFTDRLARGGTLSVSEDAPDLRGYVELALRGGFPEAALALGGEARQRWLESYVDQIVTRDAPRLEVGRDPVRLRRYFEAYALNSAGIVDDKTLYEAAGINRKTAVAYERLLENLLVIESVPTWTTNRLKRLSLSSKRYLMDGSLLAGILRLDVGAVLRDGGLLGRALDTFVAAQIRPELEVARCRPRFYHIRQEQGRHEVDLVAEVGAHRVIGIEVKATSAPRPEDGRHLAWLRDSLGSRFVAGVVLHTGQRVFPLMERILAAPIACLWA